MEHETREFSSPDRVTRDRWESEADPERAAAWLQDAVLLAVLSRAVRRGEAHHTVEKLLQDMAYVEESSLPPSDCAPAVRLFVRYFVRKLDPQRTDDEFHRWAADKSFWEVLDELKPHLIEIYG